MGFYLRKSISVGPFRFDLSGSGVGVSAGVPRFRVGAGPRGNYVHIGRAGVYYRHTFSPEPNAPPRLAPPMISISGTHAPLMAFESGSPAGIVDSSSAELLDEIRAKRRKMSLRPLAVAGPSLSLFFAIGAGLPAWALLIGAAIGCAAILAAGYRDKIAKTVVILYDFEPAVEEAFRRFTEWAQALAGVRKTWHIAASGRVFDWKYHAGASELIQRSETAVRTAEPPFLKTNVPVLRVRVGRQMLYFLPDRLLVYDAGGVGAVAYRTLDLRGAAALHRERRRAGGCHRRRSHMALREQERRFGSPLQQQFADPDLPLRRARSHCCSSPPRPRSRPSSFCSGSPAASPTSSRARARKRTPLRPRCARKSSAASASSAEPSIAFCRRRTTTSRLRESCFASITRDAARSRNRATPSRISPSAFKACATRCGAIPAAAVSSARAGSPTEATPRRCASLPNGSSSFGANCSRTR